MKELLLSCPDCGKQPEMNCTKYNGEDYQKYSCCSVSPNWSRDPGKAARNWNLWPAVLYGELMRLRNEVRQLSGVQRW